MTTTSQKHICRSDYNIMHYSLQHWSNLLKRSLFTGEQSELAFVCWLILQQIQSTLLEAEEMVWTVRVASRVCQSKGRPRLSIACSTEKLGEPGSFLTWNDVIRKWQNFAELTGSILRLVQLTTYSTLSVYDSRLPLATVDTCTCGKLLGTLALLLVWAQCTHAQLTFLPSFLSQRHSHDKRYQALSHFFVLRVTESWLGTCTRLNIHHAETSGGPY